MENKTFKLLILLMFISNCKSIPKIDEVYHESILECYDDWNMYYLPRDSMLISCLFYRQAFKERGYNPSLIIGVNENDTIGFYTQDSLGNSLCEGNKLWIYKDDSKYWTKYFLPLEETELHFPNRIMPIVYGKSETNYLICAVERIYFCKLKRLQGLKQSQ